jgi:predicted Ser/Thr protein kinase
VLSPGDVLNGRYQLTQRIAAGGMGEVWRGNDLLLHREIAVKVLLPALMSDSDFITRFRSEARMMAALRHPGIVQVYDYGENAQVGAHQLDYLVMEYIDGTPLSKKIQEAGRLGTAETMTVVAQVADALQTAHEAGIVHRDIKPSNLLVRPAGAIVLVDFGIARSTGVTGITSTNVVLGSAHYMAPEQAEGRPVTAATDVYALGAVAFSCLTGRPPYVGDNPLAVLAQLVHGQPPVLPPDVPAAVASVVLRALAKDPGQRFPSASGLAAAARGAASQPGKIIPPSYGVTPPTGPAASGAAPASPARPGVTGFGASPAASGTAPTSPARPGVAGAGAFAPGSAQVGGPSRGHYAAGAFPPGPAPAAAGAGGSGTGGFVSGPGGPGVGAVPVAAGSGGGDVTSSTSVRRRNMTMVLAAVAVVALLAGVGLILGDRYGNRTPVIDSQAGGLQGDQLQAGGGGNPQGRVSTRPSGPKASPKGGTGKTPTAAPSDDPASTGPDVPGEPTASASTGPDPSGDPGSTTPVTNPHDDPVELCGAGYTVINSKKLKTGAGVLRGTIYLLYRESGGMNCVVTIKANTLDQKTAMAAALEVQDGVTTADKGSFQYYAGPVRAAAPATCIRWGGTIGGLTFLSEWSHCT